MRRVISLVQSHPLEVVAAVMVGAVLSTFNSVLNSSATLFSQGIYRSVFRRNAGGRELVTAGRCCSVVLALAAMTVAPFINTEGSLYEYLQRINATFFGPMLAVIVLGMLTKRVSSLAAKCALILGPAAYYIIVFACGDRFQSWIKGLFGLKDNVHFLHLLAVVFLLTVLGMLAISAIRPNRRVGGLGDKHQVDMTPWTHVRVAGALITLATIVCYALLAQ